MTPPKKKQPTKKRKPRCKTCTQLRKEIRALKADKKALDKEAEELYAVVDAGAEFLTLLVDFIEKDD